MSVTNHSASMRKAYHILNGDALMEHFPKSIDGELIVMRECLVDGGVDGNDLNEFFQIRASFISTFFDGFSTVDYSEKSVSEFVKIQNVPNGSGLNLWFEDDLFCQVNMWFVLSLISENKTHPFVFLVRPNLNNPYNFGAMSEAELEIAFQNRVKIEGSELEEMSKLWSYYRKNDLGALFDCAEKLKHKFPFLLPAVQAHKNRLPHNGIPGRPSQTLMQIMDELQTSDFAILFREFNKREAIYGFGDLQVKRMLDEIRKRQR